MTIQQPLYIFLLIPVIFLAYMLFTQAIKHYKAFRDPRWKNNFNFTFGIKSLFSLGVRIISVILVVIALMGPSIPNEKMKELVSGGNILFVVDISTSMLAEDVMPNRLERAKMLMKDIVAASGSDRFGIVLFADKSVFYCPLTTDHDAVKNFIEDIDTSLLVSGGSSLKTGLERAFAAMNRQKAADGGAIAVFSDGENLENEDLSDILTKLKGAHIKAYTVGTGTEKGARIPEVVSGFFYDRKRYKKYKGKEVISKLNKENLKRIASSTSGKYFSSTAVTGKKLYEAVSKGGLKQKSSKRDFFLTKNIYVRFLMAAFLLFMISVFLMLI
ncbi:VWA domain-containing protein [Candidatus Calescamantes bacterium]|nr:VWA domain-containing protein [Candidatus Calescamantes bacterium]MCK5600120.1 VWA domain-containing protein [bacterium]